MKTWTTARIGFGQAYDSGKQQVVLSPSNDGGVVLDGVTFALAPIYIGSPYVYDQKTRVATMGDVDSATDSKLSAYVSKTDIVPSQMIPGYAENAYQATKAVMDGNGVEIATGYAKKTDLTAKQDKLPYNQYTGIYDISAWGAAQAAYVPWSGVEDKPNTLDGYGITDAATKTELAAKADKSTSSSSTANLADNAVAVVEGSAGGEVNVSFKAAYSNTLRYCELMLTGVTADNATTLVLPTGTY